MTPFSFPPYGLATFGAVEKSTYPGYPNQNLNNTLHLNPILVQTIVSAISSPSDLAQVCLVSHLFRAFAQQKLFTRVFLHLYTFDYVSSPPKLRDEPLSARAQLHRDRQRIAADTLGFFVGGNKCETVKVLSLLEGCLIDEDDYKNVKWTDNMFQTIAIQAAITRMRNIEKIEWKMFGKPSPPIFSSLTSLQNLTTLDLLWPCYKASSVIPIFGSLESLAIRCIHPIAQGTDFQDVLLSPKLRSLTLHWQRPDLTSEFQIIPIALSSYFQKCTERGYKPNLEKLGVFNLYIRDRDQRLGEFINITERMTHFTSINCVVTDEEMEAVSGDVLQLEDSPVTPKGLRFFRTDSRDQSYADMISKFEGLEELYMVNYDHSYQPDLSCQIEKFIHYAARNIKSTATINSSPESKKSLISFNRLSRLNKKTASQFLAAIASKHGPTLRHLVLDRSWLLGPSVLRNLTSRLPRLESIAIALKNSPLTNVESRQMCGFYEELALVQLQAELEWRDSVIMANCEELPNKELPPQPTRERTQGLTAVRIMVPQNPAVEEMYRSVPDLYHGAAISLEAGRMEYRSLRWFGMAGLGFQVDDYVMESTTETSDGADVSENGNRNGNEDTDKKIADPTIHWKHNPPDMLSEIEVVRYLVKRLDRPEKTFWRRPTRIMDPEMMMAVPIFAYDSLEIL